jgi:phospho-N-acetylmuramoyl-pentapeptide-transferase
MNLTATTAIAVLAFACGAAIGPRWLQFLRDHQFGKRLNPSEPSEHAHKAGTPVMGGVVFLLPVALITFAVVVTSASWILLVPLAVGAAFAVIGTLDDLRTIIGRPRTTGLSPRLKWSFQIAIGLAASVALHAGGYATIRVPFVGAVDLPAWAFISFATLVIVATTSSVAITDGMDSLLATTAALAFVAFWVIAAGRGDTNVATFSATFVGALLAYLWFNAYPAQMWMGEIGAIPLGGMLSVTALLSGEPLLLIPAGITFVANAAADIAQVLSVKLRGRRVLKYAPLHHHFTRVGWPETMVVQRFWIANAIGTMIAVWASKW